MIARFGWLDFLHPLMRPVLESLLERKMALQVRTPE